MNFTLSPVGYVSFTVKQKKTKNKKTNNNKKRSAQNMSSLVTCEKFVCNYDKKCQINTFGDNFYTVIFK